MAAAIQQLSIRPNPTTMRSL